VDSGSLIATCRDQFEFVIADSSPTLLLADPLILARHADGVILSLLEGVSRVPQAIEACQRFSSIGVPVLGAVVSGSQGASYGETAKYYEPTKSNPTPRSLVKA
jgi:Mrp family chromosome partitioning ATPase